MSFGAQSALEGHIVDCTSLAMTFPSRITHEISRDAILNMIDDFFLSGVQLVNLEGKPDIGKTQIIGQFARRHPNNAFSAFFRPNSWLAHDPRFLFADIAAQMYWALHKVELTDPHSVDESFVRRLSYDLQRVGKRNNTLYYFILDGIEDVATETGQLTSSLLALFPFEYANFRFLLSGEAAWIPTSILAKVSRKTYPVSGLSLEETISYFNGCDLQRHDIEEIYKACSRGTPGYLASVRRLIEAGLSAEQLIEQLPQQIPNPFSIEWCRVDTNDASICDALTILSHDATPHSVAELASLLHVSISALREKLVSCSFLEVPADDDGPVIYSSNSFRRFAAERTLDRRPHIWEMLAAHFLERQDSDRSIEVLPTYLEKAGKANELLTVLSPSSFVRLAEGADSFTQLRQRSEIGLSTALKLRHHGEAIRFGVQTGAIVDVSPFEIAKSEVAARLAVDDYPTALALAQSAALKRDRLQLMATIARYQRERGLSPDQTLIDSVSQLAAQVDPKELGDDLVDIAGDLMFSSPETALKLVGSLTPSTSDDRRIDWAFAKLSVLASIQPRFESRGMSNTADDLRARITDPAARRFSRTSALLLGDYSPDDVIREAETLSSAGDRLFILKQWCLHTTVPEKAATIIDYAVHLAIRTTEYTPTARDLKDLATPLSHVADRNAIPPLITAFDIQREAARRAGPTQDYIQLQLLLAEAEVRLNPQQAAQRLLETYYEMISLSNVELRAVCAGLIVAAIPKIDPTATIGDVAEVRRSSESDFRKEVTTLLGATADHYVVTRRVLEAIAVTNPALAIELSQQLNIESRRDTSLQDIIERTLELPAKRIPLDVLTTVMGRFADPDNEDDVVEKVLVRFAQVKDAEILHNALHHLHSFIQRAKTILNPVTACHALSAAMVVITKSGDLALRNMVETALRKHWESIDDPSAKLEAGYDIVVALADCSRQLAHAYLADTNELKRSFDDLSGGTFVGCLRLAIRAYSGLLPRRLESRSDFDRLSSQIDRVPSRILRVYLWTDCALRCFRLHRADDGRKIVSDKIKPLLSKLKTLSEYDWTRSSVLSAAAVYEASPALASDFLMAIPLHWRDAAIEHIVRFKLTRVPTADPYFTTEPFRHQLDYDTALEILKILGFAGVDSLVYKYIDSVVTSALWKHNRHSFAQTQRNDLAQRIRELSNKQFPNPRYIKHDGYVILAEAQANRLFREKHINWDDLVSRARNLDNDSDRSFVFAYLAEAMHSGLVQEKIDLLNEAKALADKIPSVHDKVGRLEVVATVAQDIDKTLARTALMDAMSAVRNVDEDDEDVNDDRLKLVDFAYQFDPDLASSLASSLDSDDARKSARKQIQFQRFKDQLKNPESDEGVDTTCDPRELGRAAWDLLGNLNAGRIQPRDVSETIGFLHVFRGQPLRVSFSTISWVLENALVKRAHADEAQRLMRDMFEATLSACEIAAAAICRAAGRSYSALPSSVHGSDRYIAPAGGREGAIEYLQQWLKSNALEYLKICDPYFGPRDLEILQLVLATAPDIHVTVLTSRKQQDQDHVTQPYDEYYRAYWSRNFSDQRPPRTEIVVVGGKSGELPEHDRWWLTRGHGLRIGISFNGLGLSRDSEITRLTAVEIEDRIAQTTAYVERRKREHLGDRLSYQFFEL